MATKNVTCTNPDILLMGLTLDPVCNQLDRASTKTTTHGVKYGSGDNIHLSAQLNSMRNSDDECEEERDAVRELDSAHVGIVEESPGRRRRSTFVLNFKDLSWLSSSSLRFGSGSLRGSRSGSMRNSSTNRAGASKAHDTQPGGSSATARTSG